MSEGPLQLQWAFTHYLITSPREILTRESNRRTRDTVEKSLKKDKTQVMLTKSITLLAVLTSVLFVPGTAHAADRPSSSPVAIPESGPGAHSSTSSSTQPPTSTLKNVTTELNSIRVSIDVGKFSSALTSLKIADKKYPNNADINNLLGYTSRKLKQYSQAGVYYAKALTIDPKHLGALEYQGELFMLLSKSAPAKINLAKIKAICGTNCEEYLDLKKAISNQ